jgi:AcrR family transcriptional regulator
MCNDVAMGRKYQLKQRAERQRETRNRIVEAAIELHEAIGPQRTTISAIADRAGVQRHTLYRHFPDERSLFLACSGLHMGRNPLPDPSAWKQFEDPGQRLRRGLEELYAYYERNEAMLSNVIRDAEVDDLTRETVELRVGPALGAIRQALAEALPRSGRRRCGPALDLALDFNSWRSLVRRSGLSNRQASEVMAEATLCAASSKRAPRRSSAAAR